jgi:hypothetical protein
MLVPKKSVVRSAAVRYFPFLSSFFFRGKTISLILSTHNFCFSVGDRLYVWSSKLEWPLVEVLNANTLAVEGVLQLGIDAEFGAPHLNGRTANVKLVTDGRLLYVLNIENVVVEDEKDTSQTRKPKKKSSNDCVVVYLYDPTSRRADLEIPVRFSWSCAVG